MGCSRRFWLPLKDELFSEFFHQPLGWTHHHRCPGRRCRTPDRRPSRPAAGLDDPDESAAFAVEFDVESRAARHPRSGRSSSRCVKTCLSHRTSDKNLSFNGKQKRLEQSKNELTTVWNDSGTAVNKVSSSQQTKTLEQPPENLSVMAFATHVQDNRSSKTSPRRRTWGGPRRRIPLRYSLRR